MNRNKQLDEEKKLKESFRFVLQTPDGRRVLTWLLHQTHVYRLSFSADTVGTTAFLEGERNIGLKLLRELERHPRLHLAMLEENLTERELQNQEKPKNEEDESDMDN